LTANKISWEFMSGTSFPRVQNPVGEYLKIIYDRRKHTYTVFHPKGKDAIPLVRIQSVLGGMAKPRFHRTAVQFMASRICCENLDGEEVCVKSRFSSPRFENAHEILDVKSSSLKYAAETGDRPFVVLEEEVM